MLRPLETRCLSRHDCTLSVTDHLFYDTCHVSCRMRASCACIRCRAIWCTTTRVMCPWCTPRVTLYCCMPSSRGILHVVCLRTSSMLRPSTPCYNSVYSVATHCCSAVHRLATQCTMLYVVRAHTSSATQTTVPSQTSPRAIQPRPVRPAAHLWSPVRARHAPYHMQHAIDNMQPACNIQHKANTQVGS